MRLEQNPAFQALFDHPRPPLSKLLSPERLLDQNISHFPLTYNTAFTPLTDAFYHSFQELCDSQNVLKKFKRMKKGEIVNLSENRPALHTHSRSQDKKNTCVQDVHAIAPFVETIHREKHYTDVVQIGIGGSFLGPKALVEALSCWAIDHNPSQFMSPHFISNCDPYDVQKVLKTLPIDTTLFIVVSKSGGTVETMHNWSLLKKLAEELGHPIHPKQSIAITCKNTALSQSPDFSDCFYMDEGIGGRYSSTSVVGGLIISLVFGHPVFLDLLSGAHHIDDAAETPKVTDNAMLLAACLSLTQRCVFKQPAQAVIPYASALVEFPNHLQQLVCESLGKSVTEDGQPVTLSSSPIIFGGIGTNSQHSFFQMLHQGTQAIPVDFIGIHHPTQANPLNTHLKAQILALSTGQHSDNANQHFPGNRASTLLLLDQLSPNSLGALLAFYEHKTVFEAFLMDINPFNQEGVELGKTLAKNLESKNLPPLQHTLNSLL